jgi:hypothetical protein
VPPPELVPDDEPEPDEPEPLPFEPPEPEPLPLEPPEPEPEPPPPEPLPDDACPASAGVPLVEALLHATVNPSATIEANR